MRGKNKSLARNLRKSSTDAEKLLWKYLRNRQLNGWKLRRQHPIGPYIIDFACVEARLIIEVDGGQHAANKHEDFKRTEYLEEKGYRVLRFWNNEVLQNIEAVLYLILSSLSTSNVSPSPQPSPPIDGGEGVKDKGVRL